MDSLDDRTVTYILGTRQAFEDLRQAASQLAGLLVLAASGARSASPDHPMIDAASGVCARAADSVRHALPPERARGHHREILQAAAALESAVAEARARLGAHASPDLDAILIPLRTGYAHLQRAAEMLPGFELVMFDGACCASNSRRPAALSGPLGSL
jgi:hypothetical protein